MKRKILSKQRGITLIALVVTIVVLLILAGVSIAMLAGEDGIIANAQAAKIDSIHGEVKEAVILKYGEYEIAKKTTQNTQTFIEYLEDKECIDEDGVVDTQKLTGKKLGLGNGSVESDEYKDVYIIKEIDNKYVLNYYDKDTSVNELSLWNVAIGSKSSDNLEDEECPDCGMPVDECECDNICPECGELGCAGECMEDYGEGCEYCGSLVCDGTCDAARCPDCGYLWENCNCGEESNETCAACGQSSIDGYCTGCEEPEESCICEEDDNGERCPDCGYELIDCMCGE